MTASQIVSTLEAKGCALWLEGGRVKFHDPEQVITPSILQTLQKAREQVARVVEGKPRPHLLHAVGQVADAELIEAGRLADMEQDIFKALGYTFGQMKPGDWITEQEVIRAMHPASGSEVQEILACLETAGRVLCLRRYPAQRLWRALPPQGSITIISGPVAGYGNTAGDDFTQWELSV